MTRLKREHGVEIHYRVDDFTDPWHEADAVLLIHGNNESGLAWYGWVPHLARRYKVVRPDMRGWRLGAEVLADRIHGITEIAR